MGLKPSFAFVASALLLTWAGSAAADQYRPEEFLNLDLSKAVLSPKQIGPPAQFAPVAVEAREEPSVDYRNGPRTSGAKPVHSDVAKVHTEPQVDRPVVHKSAHVTRVKQAKVEKPPASARTRVVRRHSNPLDAQAMDTRIQTWPCKSGGICDWKR